MEEFFSSFSVARVCQRQLGFLVLFRHDLWALSADCRETVWRDLHLAEFYRTSSKIWGPFPKKVTLRKIWVDFTQLSTLILNISETTQDIQNPKEVIPPAFSERSPVNLFGPLSRK